MNRTFLIILLLINITTFGFGQIFTGKVIDKETNEGIPFADIYFVELQTGTITDKDGNFDLDDLLWNKIQIQISYVGYKTIHEEINLRNVQQKVFYLEPSHINLAEVVFSVPGGKLQGENVVNIERKNITQINQGAVSLAEAISNIPGVEQNTTGGGIGKPVIRGLSGNRIVSYAQGIRVENQQWGDEHGLGVAELGIENVEVIKGPASLLYGSDALGGVLFFVDERYARHNMLEANVGSRFMSNTLGTYNDLGLKLHKNEFKMNVFGGFTSNADYKVPANDRVLNSRFNEKSFKTAIGYNTKSWISNTYYSYLQNDFGIIDEPDYTSSTNRHVETPFQKISNHALSFDNTLFIHESRVNLILGYSENWRREFEDDDQIPALDMKLKTFTYNAKWYSAPIGSHLTIIAGSQGMNQSNTNYGEEMLIPNATTIDVGLFSIANYEINKIQLQVGLRGDQRKVKTDAVIGEDHGFPALSKKYENINYSAGGVYSGEKVTFRMNLSSGFRAPSSSELLSDGVHEGTQRYEIGNPELKSEFATQIDFTTDYQTEHFNFYLSPFANFIDNYIFISPQDYQIDGTPVYAYQQTKARLFGGETGFHYHPHTVHWLHIESSLSTVIAENSQGDPLPLIPATRINTSLKAEFSHRGKVQMKDITLKHMYKFDQDRTGQFETASPAYQLFDLESHAEMVTKGRTIQLSAGIKNIFNVRYIDHLSRLKDMDISNASTNVYVGIRFGFQKSMGNP